MNLPDIEMGLSLDNTIRLDFDVGISYGQGGRLPDYKGDYEVKPKLVDQVLPTKERSMTKNLIVKEVPVARVGNLGGGYTVTIDVE